MKFEDAIDIYHKQLEEEQREAVRQQALLEQRIENFNGIIDKIPQWHKQIETIKPKNLKIYQNLGCISKKDYSTYKRGLAKLSKSLLLGTNSLEHLRARCPLDNPSIGRKMASGVCALLTASIIYPLALIDFVTILTIVKPIVAYEVARVKQREGTLPLVCNENGASYTIFPFTSELMECLDKLVSPGLVYGTFTGPLRKANAFYPIVEDICFKLEGEIDENRLQKTIKKYGDNMETMGKRGKGDAYKAFEVVKEIQRVYGKMAKK